MNANIYEKLTLIFQDVFNDDSVIAHQDLSAADVHGWDSLSHIRLILAVEREFGIRFKSAEVVGLQNTGALVKLIEKYLK